MPARGRHVARGPARTRRRRRRASRCVRAGIATGTALHAARSLSTCATTRDVGDERIEEHGDRAVGRRRRRARRQCRPRARPRRCAIDARVDLGVDAPRSSSSSSAESPASRMRDAEPVTRRAPAAASGECRRSRRWTSARRRRRRGARATIVAMMSSTSGMWRARCPRAAQVVDELLGRQPLRLRQRRAEHRGDDHFVGRAERRARSRPGTRAGTTRPIAARRPPRCAGRDSPCAAPTASRAPPSDDARSRRAR